MNVFKQRKFKQRLSLVLTFLMLASFIPKFATSVKADAALPADTPVTLVGDIISAAGLGSDWAPDNNNGLMKEYINGLYELTLSFQNAKSDGHYKVALNRSWDLNYGKDGNKNGDNISINIPANTKVTFRFDANTHQIYDSINNPDKFKLTATLVGTLAKIGGQDWNPADANFHLDYIGGGFFSKTFHLNAGSYEYKVAYEDKWSNGEVGSNVALTVTEARDVTFLANPVTGVCTDSVNTSSIAGNISLIGTIRGGDDWTADKKGFEFAPLTGDGKYVYSGFFPAGNYEYKGIENYSWDGNGIPASGNNSISIPDGGKYVVFFADRANRTIYDSIKNPREVAIALGLTPPEVTVKSPVINPNGTVTFNYKDENATSVSLRGGLNGWGETPMTKDANTNIWSVTLRLGDTAQNVEYKFFVNGSNWITDPVNSKYSNGNSLLEFPAFSGRKVVLAGTIQTAAGESTWNPSSDKTKLSYDGNGQYHLTITNVPAGNYEYKIAMGSWDPENYGANGKSYGDNMKVYVPVQQDVTFWYSDDSHYTANSVDYKKLDISLTGTGIPADLKLTDPLLTNIYTKKVTLSKGTYSDIKAVVDGKEYNYGSIVITDTSKDVTFSFAPAIEMAFSDAASQKISLGDLYFDSRSEAYKTPYGAVPTGSNVTFNLKAKKDDLTVAKLVLTTNKGTKIIDMNKNGSFSDGSDKWSLTYKFDEIGMDKYYFLVSNGSDVKAYSDDDGYFGAGTATDISNIRAYDLNIYDKDFKTPDWMKNAVIYQIFPDRFFDGDYSNDYAQKLARGSVAYETPNNWYMPPEDPQIEFKRDKDGNIVKDANGKPVLDPDYKGLLGDGEWSNDMYGGDLKGVQAKLDYLQGLGVNVLYFNPVSQSISNHRYDTTDYRNVDPLLGHIDDFVNLAKEAHNRGMHVILDGVFNHVSDDSVYFDRYGKYIEKGKPIGAYQYWSKVYDLMNTQGLNQQDAEKKVTANLAAQGITDLHYKDWFKVDNVIVDTGKPSERYQYEGWWGYDSMPVIQALNGSEYQVNSWANEIIDGPDANSRYWLREGSNGWRLDVANEVSDETWNHFRGAVKQEGDNAIIGEIWDDASRYLLGDMYDSVMNYRFRNAALYFVKGTQDDNKTPTDAVWAMNELEKMREQYPKEAFEAMMNLVDSHDTQRAISALDGYQKSQKAVANDPTPEAYAKMKLIPLIQMTYPGAPTIYYGDEAGMSGADDPDNRRGMIWGKGNQELVEWYANLANIRNSYSVLRTGDIVPVTVDDANKADVMAYSRNDQNNHALVVVSRKAQDITGLQLNAGSIPNGTVLKNVLNSSEKYTVVNGAVTVDVPKQSGLILVPSTSFKAVTVNNTALKDAYDPNYIVKDKVRATGITLNKSSLDLILGDTAKLKASIVPQNATLANVVWSSSNEAVVKVDGDGNLTPVAVGTVEVTAKTLDGGFTAKCVVTVKKGIDNTPSTVVDAVKNTDSNGKIVVDATTNTKADKSIFEALKGTDKSVSFVSGDTVWTFNGQDIDGKNLKDIDLTVQVSNLQNSTSPNKDAIAEKVKNTDVLVINFADNGVLPGKAAVKVKLDASWLEGKNKDNIYVYYYNSTTDKAEIVAKQLKVDANGYIEFEITHNSDYFVSDKDLAAAGILPKTGSVVDYTTLSTSGILVMCIGVLVLAAGRRNKETEE